MYNVLIMCATAILGTIISGACSACIVPQLSLVYIDDTKQLLCSY